MPDTMLRFKIEDVRILLECQSCHSQVFLDPFSQKLDPAAQRMLLRCPTCSGAVDWTEVEQSIAAVVTGMRSIRRSSNVRAGFCVMVPNAAAITSTTD